MFLRTASLQTVTTTRLSPTKGDRVEYMVDGLRITFSVKRTLSKNSNDAKISVFNLSESTRSTLERKPTHVRLSVGYQDSGSQLLFGGDVRYVEHTHTHTNGTWETKLEVGEAERALLHARLTKSYAEGTTRETILRDLCTAMQIPVPIRLPAAVKAAALNGFSAYGRASDSLARLIAPHRYMIVDGVLRLENQDYEFVASLSESTGLVSTPEIEYDKQTSKPKKIKVACVLSPEIMPGSRIQVKSKRFEGTVRVESVEHVGDTHGNDWITKMECKI